MQKQKDLESKSRNMPSETVSRQLSKHIPSRHESFENNDTEEYHCPPQSTFDNVPLPTTRVRAPRKVFKHLVIPNLGLKDLSNNFVFR